MAQPLATPFSYFADANGVPLAGGKVYTYAAGTTTPQNSYTDSTGVTPAANPVVLDSAGRATIWLQGYYKIVVTDSLGTIISTTDNITALGSTGDMNTSLYDPNSIREQLVGLSAVQTLSNKSATTQTSNTASLLLANMTAVQNSMLGGFVNKFRNPGFSIAQRGTSGTITAGSPAYSVDGWIISATGANVTWSASGAYTLANSSVAPGSLTITGASSNSDVLVKQRIESFIAGALANQQNTFQATFTNNTGATLTPTITVKHAGSADNWGAPVTDVSAVSLQSVASGAQGTVSYTFAGASNSYFGLEVTVDFGAMNSNAKNIILSAWDIRATPGVGVGLNSSPPIVELRPTHTELAYNQRYLPAFISSSTTSTLGNVAETSSTTYLLFLVFPTQTRAAPTGLTISNATHITDNHSGANIVSSAVAFSTASQNSASVQVTIASGGTAGYASYAYFNSASASIIFTGAEL